VKIWVAMLFISQSLIANAESKPIWANEKLPRKERLQSCAKCHPESYAHWLKGPHAAASERLDAYKAEVRRNPSYPEDEKKIIQRKDCIFCHAPHNMFETKMPLDFDVTKKFDLSDRIFVRDDNHTSGIDCLSCHAKGDRVVTRADYKPSVDLKKDSDFCNPIPSTMFSNTNTCLTCHILVEKQHFTYEEKHKGEKLKTCIECHMERRPDGKYSHYIFWAHDKTEDYKRRPKDLMPFDKVKLSVTKIGKDRFLKIQWDNKFAPHNIIPSGPRQDLFKLEIFDKDATKPPLYTHYIRFSADVFVNEGPKPKDSTNTFLPFDGSYKDKFRLPTSVPKKGLIKFTAFRKASYYLDNWDAKKFYERDVPY
jgi:hypothetical protein